MKQFRLDLWKDGEYTYAAAYGFMPNVRVIIHVNSACSVT